MKRERRTRKISEGSKEQFRDSLLDCQQGQLFPHKPVVYLRDYLTVFLTHSPSGFPHSPYKNKRALFRAVPSAGHSRIGCWLSQWHITWVKEWSSSLIKSLRIILMLRKWSVSSKFYSYETIFSTLIQASTTDVMGVHMKAEPGSLAMIIINRITFGAITKLHECSVLEHLQKTSFLIKKDRQRGLTALWNYILKSWLHVDAIPLSDRNKLGVTSQKIMEFLQWKIS